MVSWGHRNVVLSKNDFTRNFHYQIIEIYPHFTIRRAIHRPNVFYYSEKCESEEEQSYHQ